MKLYLIRHGRQCDKRCNVDVSLSEEGIRQAKLAGMRMKDWGVEKESSAIFLAWIWQSGGPWESHLRMEALPSFITGKKKGSLHWNGSYQELLRSAWGVKEN